MLTPKLKTGTHSNPAIRKNYYCLFLRIFSVVIFPILLMSAITLSSETAVAQKRPVRPKPRPTAAPKKQTSPGDKIVDEGTELLDKTDQGSWQMAVAKFEQAQQLFANSNDQEGVANALVLAARAYKKLGNLPEIINKYNAAYNIYKQINDREGQASILNNLGALSRDRQMFDESINYYQNALPLMRETGNKEGQGAVLNGLGESYLQKKQFPQAIDNFNQALTLWIQLNAKEDAARTATNIANIYSYSEETRAKALPLYNQALAIAHPLRKPVLESWIIGRLAAYYDQSGDKQKALEYSQNALAVARSMQSDETKGSIAVSTAITGDLNYRMANMEAALPLLESAVQQATSLNNAFFLQFFLVGLGEYYISKGEQAKAFEYLNQAHTYSQQIGDKKGESAALTIMGEASMVSLNTSDALRYLTQAVQLAESQTETSTEIRALSDMSRVYTFMNNRDAALQALKKAAALRPDDGNFEVLFEVKLANAFGYQAFDSPQNAVQAFTDALNYSRKMGFKQGEARALYGLGFAYQKGGDFPKALETMNQALALQKKIGNQLAQASLLIGISNQNMNLNQFPAAMQALQEALSIAEAKNIPYVRAIALHDTGFAYAKMGNGDKAIEYYNAALPVFESLNDKMGQGRTYGNLALVYEAMGNKKKAKEFKKKADDFK